MGFVQPKDKPAAGLDQKVERTAVEAARRKFSPEFMNRLDKVVVFHPLRREQLEEVLEIELGQVQQRVLETAKGQFLFRVTTAGQRVPAAGRYRPALRSAAPEAGDRAARGLSAGEFAGYRAGALGRPSVHRLEQGDRRIELCSRARADPGAGGGRYPAGLAGITQAGTRR